MRIFTLFAKVAVTFGLGWFVIRSLEIRQIASHLARTNLIALALALGVFTTQIFVLGYRWVLVIGCLDGSLPMKRGLSITFISQFFSQALPSSVGGDAVRIWFACREGVDLRRSFQSVIDDRILATSMLLFLVVLSIPAQLRIVPSGDAILCADAAVLTCLIGLVVVLGFTPLARKWLVRKRPMRELLDFAVSLRKVFLHGKLSAFMLAMSLCNHLLSIIGVMLLASSLGLSLDWTSYLVLVPLIMLMTMIPLSIGGWGVREGAMVVGFGFVGMSGENAVALSILFGIASAVVSLPGGILWGLSHMSVKEVDLTQQLRKLPTRVCECDPVERDSAFGHASN